VWALENEASGGLGSGARSLGKPARETGKVQNVEISSNHNDGKADKVLSVLM
jgi:hypothetical protein